MKKIITILMALMLLLPCSEAYAFGAITNVSYQTNITMAPLTLNLMEDISRSTPVEPEGSDLKVIHPATRIATKRLPQGYTFDQNYCYYLSNVANIGKKKNTLRLTRVQYDGNGHYSESYMTLVDFGHGTNIDCVNVNGTTWLWTSSDKAKTISCFKFQPGKTIKKHAKKHYTITKKGSKKKATNVQPAIDPSGKILAVRYMEKGKQCFQYYSLINGNKIKPKKILRKVKLSCPKNTYQGYDIAGGYIYTVEGTRSATECQDIHEKYEPIRVRKYNSYTKACAIQTITGAADLLHREPEGIKVNERGEIFLNITSHYKDLYTCVNVYQVK